MSHENSITIESRKGKGRWVNIPTVVGGKTLDRAAAEDLYREKKIHALGGQSYNSMESAVKAAKKRSKDYKP